MLLSVSYSRVVKLCLLWSALSYLGFGLLGFLFVRRQKVKLAPRRIVSVCEQDFLPSALALADPVAVGGNRCSILNNGAQIFPEMLAAISAAKLSISFEAFLFEDGLVGSEFLNALCEKARCGVKIHILLDAIGSGLKLEDSYEKRFKTAGCAFAYYHPTNLYRLDRLNRRTHRRILVIDGRIGFTGGVGFADHWRGHGRAAKEWRDVHAKLEGPIVGKLQAQFQQHWLKSTGEVLSGPAYYPELCSVGTVTAQVVASTEFTFTPLQWAVNFAIISADHRIWITNAYCVPNSHQTALLIDAASRGVDVRILIPGEHNDQPTAEIAARPAYTRLVEGGVKVYRYLPSMIHSKTLVVDGLFSVLGSSNFDPRSSEINEELDIVFYDSSVSREMELVFLRDLEHSILCSASEFTRRSFGKRALEWFILPFRSQV